MPSRRRPRRVGRRARPRSYGRTLSFLGFVNVLISFLVPWLVIPGEGLNLFSVLAHPDTVRFVASDWNVWASWLIAAAAAVVVVAIVADRYVDFGVGPGPVCILGGLVFIAYPLHLFLKEPSFRQIGPLVCFPGGMALIFGGLNMMGKPWREPARAQLRALAARADFPWVSLAIAVVNAAVYFATAYQASYETKIVRELGLIGGSVRWYAFFTSMFLHGDIVHLLSNVVTLLVLGFVLERRIGRAVLLVVYLVCGVAGGVASILIDPRIYSAAIGASGAVAGLVGVCCLVAPDVRVSVPYYLAAMYGWIRVRAGWVLSFWIMTQTLGAFYLAIGHMDNIGYWSHLGGVFTGLAAGAVLRRLVPAAPAEAEAGGNNVFPQVLIAVSAGLSVLVVVLTMTSSTLLGRLGEFQRAWNSGELERVTELFEPRHRDLLRRQFGKIMPRLDGEAEEGKTRIRASLYRITVMDDRCRAIYATAPRGVDPYRSPEMSGKMVVSFRESHDGWYVRGIDFRKFDPVAREVPVRWFTDRGSDPCLALALAAPSDYNLRAEIDNSREIPV